MSFTPVNKKITFINGGWDAFNNLIIDLLSTANGKGASQVGVEDSSGYFSSTNVEDVLAELRDDTSTTVSLAETFSENSSTTTSLTWGFNGGLFRLDNIVTDVSDGTIGLTDDSTNYVEINPATGLMTKNTSSFTSGSIPIREVITSSGSQTTSTDKRAWFSQVAAGTLTTAGINNLATSGSIKTDNYTVTTADTETQIILGAATAADKIFTLLSVGSGEDGMVVHFLNLSDYKLTIKPSDTDSVWNSGEGYGIETTQPGASCSLRYVHATTSWDTLQMGGGMWMVEGLKLWVPGTQVTVKDTDVLSTVCIVTEKTGRHSVQGNNGLRVNGLVPYKYPASILLDGTDESLEVIDSSDFDIGASNTDDFGILLRCRFDSAAGSIEGLMAQIESASDEWFKRREASGAIGFGFETSLGSGISLIGTTLTAASTWYNIFVAKIADEWGLYIGTGNVLSQEDYDNTAWSVDSFVAALDIGKRGTTFLDGNFNDAVIVNQNLFNAAPTVGLSDTITLPENLNLTAGGN